MNKIEDKTKSPYCKHKDFWFGAEHIKFCTDCGKNLGPVYVDYKTSEWEKSQPGEKEYTPEKITINDLEPDVSPLGIIRERLAKGEITIEEFKELKSILS